MQTHCKGACEQVKDKIFKGFLVAAATTLLVDGYGTVVNDLLLVFLATGSGLGISAIAWWDFLRQNRRDKKEWEKSGMTRDSFEG